MAAVAKKKVDQELARIAAITCGVVFVVVALELFAFALVFLTFEERMRPVFDICAIAILLVAVLTLSTASLLTADAELSKEARKTISSRQTIVDGMKSIIIALSLFIDLASGLGFVAPRQSVAKKGIGTKLRLDHGQSIPMWTTFLIGFGRNVGIRRYRCCTLYEEARA